MIWSPTAALCAMIIQLLAEQEAEKTTCVNAWSHWGRPRISTFKPSDQSIINTPTSKRLGGCKSVLEKTLLKPFSWFRSFGGLLLAFAPGFGASKDESKEPDAPNSCSFPKSIASWLQHFTWRFSNGRILKMMLIAVLLSQAKAMHASFIKSPATSNLYQMDSELAGLNIGPTGIKLFNIKS